MSDNLATIQPELWGKDHWSVLAYLETLAVDYEGFAKPDARRMTTNHATHAHLGNPLDGAKYPTRLNDGTVAQGHDDYDCIDDAVDAGILEDIGTGFTLCFKFTKYGTAVVFALREHKMSGKNFGDFKIPDGIKKEVKHGEGTGN